MEELTTQNDELSIQLFWQEIGKLKSRVTHLENENKALREEVDSLNRTREYERESRAGQDW